MEKQRSRSIYQLCMMALMAGVMCFLSPIAIPIGAVPISLSFLAIYLSVYILGMKMGTVSCMVYLLLGFAGLPVFSGYTGGVAKLAGPTGGYLVGYIFLALICGWIMEKSSYQLPWCFVGMAAGSAAAYAFGTVWFMIVMDCSLVAALSQCVIPFLFGDFLKMAAASVIGPQVRRRLKLAGLLDGHC